MEPEINETLAGQQERPTTRWRRGDRQITRSREIDDPLILPDSDQTLDQTLTKHRPVSRRGIMSRQTAMTIEERPYTQQSTMRPMTAGRTSVAGVRPQSSLHRSGVQRSSSRLTSVMQSSQARTGTAMGLAGMGVIERPITQQGLSGMKTSSKGPPMRQVQDKRYYEGLLQMRIRELTEEILRLSRNIDSQSKEQSTFLLYDSRVKEMAAELTELQGTLADYNLVVDKLNTDTDLGDIDAECRELKSRNDHESNELEKLFAEQKQRLAQIQQLELEIDQERHMTENLLAAMSPPLREHYSTLQQNNDQLQQEMDSLQQQLDFLTSKKTMLDDQLSISQVKREAVHLYYKLHEIEERKKTLEEEEKARATPAQEREQLLQRVKDDNAEMATMERQISELKDEIRRRKEELEQIEQDLDESQSERHQKFRELRRREETMEEFLSTFEESREQEMARISQVEADIVTTLQQMSRNLGHSHHIPTVDDFSAMKDNLAYKEGELEKSKKTIDSLGKEKIQLQTKLQKVENLEEKINGEMISLKEQMISMSKEMITLSDLDSLRSQLKDKQVSLEQEREILRGKEEPTKKLLKEAQTKHAQLKKELSENETYIQLSNLERKLAQLEQNNFTIQEFVASKKTETAYEPTKVKVFEMTKELNKALKENLKLPGA